MRQHTDRLLRTTIGAALLSALTLVAQEPSPQMRELLGKIASDPRMKDVNQYIRGLKPAAALKTDMIKQGRVPDLNYVYGWDLGPDGRWPVERLNDIVFEIVLSQRYNASAFLMALEKGAPFLRKLREGDCLDRFNEKYHLSIPQTGGLSFPQAETFLYSVVAAPGFDPDRALSGLCQGTSRVQKAPVPVTATQTRAAVIPNAGDAAPPAESDPGRLQVIAILIGGGLVPLTLIVFLFRSISRDLAKRVRR